MLQVGSPGDWDPLYSDDQLLGEDSHPHTSHHQHHHTSHAHAHLGHHGTHRSGPQYGGVSGGGGPAVRRRRSGADGADVPMARPDSSLGAGARGREALGPTAMQTTPPPVLLHGASGTVGGRGEDDGAGLARGSSGGAGGTGGRRSAMDWAADGGSGSSSGADADGHAACEQRAEGPGMQAGAAGQGSASHPGALTLSASLQQHAAAATALAATACGHHAQLAPHSTQPGGTPGAASIGGIAHALMSAQHAAGPHGAAPPHGNTHHLGQQDASHQQQQQQQQPGGWPDQASARATIPGMLSHQVRLGLAAAGRPYGSSDGAFAPPLGGPSLPVAGSSQQQQRGGSEQQIGLLGTSLGWEHAGGAAAAMAGTAASGIAIPGAAAAADAAAASALAQQQQQQQLYGGSLQAPLLLAGSYQPFSAQYVMQQQQQATQAAAEQQRQLQPHADGTAQGPSINENQTADMERDTADGTSAHDQALQEAGGTGSGTGGALSQGARTAPWPTPAGQMAHAQQMAQMQFQQQQQQQQLYVGSLPYSGLVPPVMGPLRGSSYDGAGTMQ